MEPPRQEAVLRVMAQDAAHIDRFIAVSADYAARLSGRAGARPRARGRGLPRRGPVGLSPRRRAAPARDDRLPVAPRAVRGLRPLRGGVHRAAARPALRGRAALRNRRPCADRRFLKRQLARLAAAGLGEDVTVSPERFAGDRAGFLLGADPALGAGRRDARGVRLLRARGDGGGRARGAAGAGRVSGDQRAAAPGTLLRQGYAARGLCAGLGRAAHRPGPPARRVGARPRRSRRISSPARLSPPRSSGSWRAWRGAGRPDRHAREAPLPGRPRCEWLAKGAGSPPAVRGRIFKGRTHGLLAK